MESNYRDFITQFPDRFIALVEVRDEVIERELVEKRKFQYDSKNFQFAIFKKEDLNDFFGAFYNIPSKVIWEDKDCVITKDSPPYTIQISGVFHVEPPKNIAINNKLQLEYLLPFTFVSDIQSRQFFL